MNAAHNAVFGLGNNIDFEVTCDLSTIIKLAEQYDIRKVELTEFGRVQSERDLLVSILEFMRQGNGGEYFVETPQVLAQCAARFSIRRTLGGTSVRSAIAAAKRGMPVTLHLVSMNEDTRRLLPKGCEYLCSAECERLYPHLIVQFNKGQHIEFGDIDFTVPRSNRVIYVNDPDNCNLLLSDRLGDALANARLFLISGFNAMRDEMLLQNRLDTLVDSIRRLPKGGRVFFEDACYHNKSFGNIVNRALVPYVDIFSMNEDELSGYVRRSINLLDAQEVAGALREVRHRIPVPQLVVHTRYWALCFGKDVAELAPALRGGIAMATTRLCLGDDYTEQDYQKTTWMAVEREGAQFAVQISELLGHEAWCEPSILVSTNTPTTIGLGDAFVGGFLAEYLFGIMDS